MREAKAGQRNHSEPLSHHRTVHQHGCASRASCMGGKRTGNVQSSLESSPMLFAYVCARAHPHSLSLVWRRLFPLVCATTCLPVWLSFVGGPTLGNSEKRASEKRENHWRSTPAEEHRILRVTRAKAPTHRHRYAWKQRCALVSRALRMPRVNAMRACV